MLTLTVDRYSANRVVLDVSQYFIPASSPSAPGVESNLPVDCRAVSYARTGIWARFIIHSPMPGIASPYTRRGNPYRPNG